MLGRLADELVISVLVHTVGSKSAEYQTEAENGNKLELKETLLEKLLKSLKHVSTIILSMPFQLNTVEKVCVLIPKEGVYDTVE